MSHIYKPHVRNCWKLDQRWVMSVGWVKPAERLYHLIREEIFKNEVKLVNLLFCDVNQSTSVERQNWWWRHVDHVTSAFCWHFCTLKHWRWITKWDGVKNPATLVQYYVQLLYFSRCLTVQLLYQRNMLHLGGRRPPDPKNWPVRPDGVALARCDPHRDPSVAPQCLLEAPSTPPPQLPLQHLSAGNNFHVTFSPINTDWTATFWHLLFNIRNLFLNCC